MPNDMHPPRAEAPATARLFVSKDDRGETIASWSREGLRAAALANYRRFYFEECEPNEVPPGGAARAVQHDLHQHLRRARVWEIDLPVDDRAAVRAFCSLSLFEEEEGAFRFRLMNPWTSSDPDPLRGLLRRRATKEAGRKREQEALQKAAAVRAKSRYKLTRSERRKLVREREERWAKDAPEREAHVARLAAEDPLPAGLHAAYGRCGSAGVAASTIYADLLATRRSDPELLVRVSHVVGEHRGQWAGTGREAGEAPEHCRHPLEGVTRNEYGYPFCGACGCGLHLTDAEEDCLDARDGVDADGVPLPETHEVAAK